MVLRIRDGRRRALRCSVSHTRRHVDVGARAGCGGSSSVPAPELLLRLAPPRAQRPPGAGRRSSMTHQPPHRPSPSPPWPLPPQALTFRASAMDLLNSNLTGSLILQQRNASESAKKSKATRPERRTRAHQSPPPRIKSHLLLHGLHSPTTARAPRLAARQRQLPPPLSLPSLSLLAASTHAHPRPPTPLGPTTPPTPRSRATS